MLLDLLLNHYSSGSYPMHMPGHKRNPALINPYLPFNIDITEIHGFDNLYSPNGILKLSANLASSLYGSNSAFLLVNGSTSGILAAIASCNSHGDSIIIARNCHASVYNAAAILALNPIFIYPDSICPSGIAGSISPDQIQLALARHPDVKSIVITSPSYDGVISDVANIALVAHNHNIPLIVDEAHGAHLGFSHLFPLNASRLGADIAVMSLHKTLPALTQSALLHLNGSLVAHDSLSHFISAFQTSSPSYVLLASIDHCLDLLSTQSEHLFYDFFARLSLFYDHASNLSHLRVIDPRLTYPYFFKLDPSKIIISSLHSSLNGSLLADMLRLSFNIQLEMACPLYALALSSIADPYSAFLDLARALSDLDGSASFNSRVALTPVPPRLKLVVPMHSALNPHAKRVSIPYSNAIGRVAADFLRAFPPGIPITAPGELISAELIDYIKLLSSFDIPILNSSGSNSNSISVLI